MEFFQPVSHKKCECECMFVIIIGAHLILPVSQEKSVNASAYRWFHRHRRSFLINKKIKKLITPFISLSVCAFFIQTKPLFLLTVFSLLMFFRCCFCCCFVHIFVALYFCCSVFLYYQTISGSFPWEVVIIFKSMLNDNDIGISSSFFTL